NTSPTRSARVPLHTIGTNMATTTTPNAPTTHTRARAVARVPRVWSDANATVAATAPSARRPVLGLASNASPHSPPANTSMVWFRSELDRQAGSSHRSSIHSPASARVTARLE